LMYVIGATRPAFLEEVRKIIPEHFLLVPGVGAQGGSLEEVAKFGMNEDIGLLVNSSRGIIFASEQEDFAEAARSKAKSISEKMRELIC
ncbi:MAG: orotidine 5'-phosphate decarboxylase, partial [Saprospiraceae bacterium]|nr:orotidine 5'-phosphate decarboxylase [Saprospiraceae bacterium]